ncbi:hypothetical protein HPC49_09720 [Pyxidicoccus fallax]|uniref:Lanthionine biosynthesis cyclase LanC n=2 Tax=Pyxidicoccus fallax TaxID=394095 RepID=A0A848LDL8_9BACT|nr:lanthionine synthetase LanC family protein [Pyxidicoccus fallax]NMO13528.1 hypothetical protein [Pyxidicoccus fallax]NPC78521.1 hypothetical protein [Pyxidicoccus fallax]
MSSAPAWHPVLDGAERLRALELARGVYEALRAGALRRANPSLDDGLPSAALLSAYLARAGLDSGEPEALLEAAAARAADVTLDASLFRGFTGLAWALAHLDAADADGLEDVDEQLEEVAAGAPAPGRGLDLISGLAGVGVYALERLPDPRARALLARVAVRLTEAAQRAPQGRGWWTPAEHLPPTKRERFPSGAWDLGLAHGAAGMLAVLAGAHRAEVLTPAGRDVLMGARTFLEAQCEAHRAPAYLPPTGPAASTRPAWCYGTPGVALGLFWCARALDDAEGEARALVLARAAAREAREEEARFEEPGLCHGTAGLAHFFNRLYQASGDATLGEAARQWLRRTLDSHQVGQGVGGFRARGRQPDGRLGWTEEPGLVVGATGVALALLAGASAIEPGWDRTMLFSVRGL